MISFPGILESLGYSAFSKLLVPICRPAQHDLHDFCCITCQMGRFTLFSGPKARPAWLLLWVSACGHHALVRMDRAYTRGEPGEMTVWKLGVWGSYGLEI